MSLSLMNVRCHDLPTVPFHSVRVHEKLHTNQIKSIFIKRSECMWQTYNKSISCGTEHRIV